MLRPKAERDGRSQRLPGAFLLLPVALTLVGFNLRAAVTSLGAVLAEVQSATDMTDTAAGVLTSLPLVTFGLVGLLGRWLDRRLGLEGALLAGMVALTVGLAARIMTSQWQVFLLATAVALAGIAAANVLAPVAVKQWYPNRIGWATSTYTITLAIGNGLASASTVPVAEALGSWRVGLAVWVLPAGAAALVLSVLCRRTRRPSAHGAGTLPCAAEPAVRLDQKRKFAFIVFFGMQTLGAFTVMGWLPTIYRSAGVSPNAAGFYLGIVAVLGAPMAVILPRIAARTEHHAAMVVTLMAFNAAAYWGLLAAPAAMPALWALLLGIGFGAFPLALVLIGLRTSTRAGTAQLSTATQGYGYLLAASGPVLVGLLHDATADWKWPLAVLILLLVPQLLAGLIAARPGAVDHA